MEQEQKTDTPQELSATRHARMFNFLAMGTSRAGLGICGAFTAISGTFGYVLPAIVFGLGTAAQAGLAWLNTRHLKAHEARPQPYIESPERAAQRRRGAFQRAVAPAVVTVAAFAIASLVTPDPVASSNPQAVRKHVSLN